MRKSVGLHFGSRGWPSADQLQELTNKFAKLQDSRRTEPPTNTPKIARSAKKRQ